MGGNGRASRGACRGASELCDTEACAELDALVPTVFAAKTETDDLRAWRGAGRVPGDCSGTGCAASSAPAAVGGASTGEG